MVVDGDAEEESRCERSGGMEGEAGRVGRLVEAVVRLAVARIS